MLWRSSRRLLALAFIALFVNTVPVAAQGSISREQELAVGRVAAARLMTQYPVVVDADWIAFLGTLRDTLTPFSGRTDVPHQIIIVEEATPNAGSTPGYLFFTTGLVRLGMDRHGWAFVVAHEIAHTARRHVAAEMLNSVTLRRAIASAIDRQAVFEAARSRFTRGWVATGLAGSWFSAKPPAASAKCALRG